MTNCCWGSDSVNWVPWSVPLELCLSAEWVGAFNPEIKLQQFSSWMLPNHNKIGNIYLTGVQCFTERRFSQLILVLLMVREEMMVIWLTKIVQSYFQVYKKVLQIVSLLILSKNGNNFIWSVQFYATLHGVSVVFCELKNQGWSRLHIHILPAKWKGGRVVNVWGHLRKSILEL